MGYVNNMKYTRQGELKSNTTGYIGVSRDGKFYRAYINNEYIIKNNTMHTLNDLSERT